MVTSVERERDGFIIETGGGPIHGASLVIASGGLSIPKMGATNFGYELAKRFGHTIVPTRPALVPLTFSADDLARYQDLSGIGLPVEASCHRQSFSGPMLFTHRGISGPAILQVSSYWAPGQALDIDLLRSGGAQLRSPQVADPRLGGRITQARRELVDGVRAR